MTVSLSSLIDMNKYASLLNGLGNPGLTLLAIAPSGQCVWKSRPIELDAEARQWVQQEMDSLQRNEADAEATPLISYGQIGDFKLGVLLVSEENPFRLAALVLLEPLASSTTTQKSESMSAEQSDALLVSLKKLLLNEICPATSLTSSDIDNADGSNEIRLLDAINKMVPTYINARKAAHASTHVPGETEKVLADILAECTASLSIDQAVLYLNADKLLLSSPQVQSDEQANSSLLRLARRDSLIFESCSAEAVLTPADCAAASGADHRGRNLSSQYDRLLVCIPDSLGRVAGTLAFLRDKSQSAAFTVNERRVLELLVRPVLQIINADFDAITGFLNTAGFYPKLVDKLAQVEAQSHESCLLQIRFGQLLSIGDRCGSEALDEAVLQLAAILSKRIRNRDLTARRGSSDFLLYLEKCSAKDAETLSESLLDTLKGYRFSFKDQLFDINAFIGVVPVARTDRDIRNVLDAAEAACADAMHQGINGYSVYEPKHKVAVRNSGLIIWSDRIIETLRDEKLHLYTQPVAALPTLNLIDHYEVLLRVKSDNSLLVAPSVFVRVAERCRLIEQVDKWVVRNAFSQLNQIYAKSPSFKVTLSINISGLTLNEHFPAFVIELMQDMCFPSHAVIFEITEASAVSNMKFVVQAVKTMRQEGFRFSLDDFGAGMGSFAFLQNLSVDRIKIDGALIRGITRSEVNHSIVEALQAVSSKMKLQTTAKLVDNEAVLAAVKTIGVDFVQGHLIAKPSPIAQLLKDAAQHHDGIRGGLR